MSYFTRRRLDVTRFVFDGDGFCRSNARSIGRINQMPLSRFREAKSWQRRLQFASAGLSDSGTGDQQRF